MKIPRSDPVKTCGRAITMDDFRDEKIITESGPDLLFFIYKLEVEPGSPQVGYGGQIIGKLVSTNVRFWLLADIPAYVDLCPLSGVKRTCPPNPHPS